MPDHFDNAPSHHAPQRDLDHPPQQRSKVGAVVAWIIIIAVVLFVGIQQNLPAEQPAEPDPNVPAEDVHDVVGVKMMEFQSRLLVGQHATFPKQSVKAQVELLNTGTVSQRLRYVVLVGETEGPHAASNALDDILARAARKNIKLSPQQEAAAVSLREMYSRRTHAPEDAEAARLTTQEREALEPLGWFGKLAAAPEAIKHVEPEARAEAIRPAQQTFLVIISAAFTGVGAGFLGFIGLIILIVFMLMRRVAARLSDRASPLLHHGIYAETFALWLLLFLGLQMGAGLMAIPPDISLLVSGFMFFLSLIALLWPALRGVPFTQVRRDIGWYLNPPGGVLDALSGIGGYMMGLPVLAIGVGFTFLLMRVQGMLSGVGDPIEYFGETGGPAHPIIGEFADPSLGLVLQIFFVASVAAPIVEETMFRGVLYRHLRSGTRSMDTWLSVLLSGVINSLIFAVIHPQGWIAIPLLGAIAFVMTIARELRGSLLSSIIIHGLSNGLVMLMLLLALG
ncbi:MAG: CPBP family intramembrane glutamic endopeptidase [Phycisphaerales bacterium]